MLTKTTTANNKNEIKTMCENIDSRNEAAHCCITALIACERVEFSDRMRKSILPQARKPLA